MDNPVGMHRNSTKAHEIVGFRRGPPKYTVDLVRSFSNSTSSPLSRAIAAYRRLDVTRTPHERPHKAPKRAKWLNETELARLTKRYGSGATVYELATEFGVHRTTISQHLKAAGVQMRLQAMTAEQVKTATTLYATGLSLADVGGHLGVHASTVYLTLRQYGVAMRNPWDHPRQRGADTPDPSPNQ